MKATFPAAIISSILLCSCGATKFQLIGDYKLKNNSLHTSTTDSSTRNISFLWSGFMGTKQFPLFNNRPKEFIAPKVFLKQQEGNYSLIHTFKPYGSILGCTDLFQSKFACGEIFSLFTSLDSVDAMIQIDTVRLYVKIGTTPNKVTPVVIDTRSISTGGTYNTTYGPGYVITASTTTYDYKAYIKTGNVCQDSNVHVAIGGRRQPLVGFLHFAVSASSREKALERISHLDSLSRHIDLKDSVAQASFIKTAELYANTGCGLDRTIIETPRAGMYEFP